MKLKNNIFGSRSERNAFKALSSRWSPKLLLYPGLPLSSIIEIDKNDLSDGEEEYFYKTSVDYTFCNQDDNPILSVEFDSLGEGFSKDGEYIPSQPSKDPFRKLKMDFKLKLAKSLLYPFFVISYEEIELLNRYDTLTVLDAAIGKLLSGFETSKLINKTVQESEEELNTLKRESLEMAIQDIVFGAEIEAEYLNNPIKKEKEDYHTKLGEFAKSLSYCSKWLYDPPIPDNLIGAKRLEATSKVDRVGVCFELRVKPSNQTFKETLWIRNFGGYYIDPHIIAEDIAQYLCFKKAYNTLAKNIKT